MYTISTFRNIDPTDTKLYSSLSKLIKQINQNIIYLDKFNLLNIKEIN